ncbi:MAG TPA: CdaR family protein [Spirochaetota bacterium]|nr:CdaR family protein [Spirochaetota bacterium]HSA16193.1 CdaR family protein [Spirochaetota bacterium]
MKSFFNMIAEYVNQRNILAKSACLALAIVLWAYISTTKNEESNFRIAIETVNLPEYMTVSDMQYQNIDVVVEGKKELVKAVNPKTIRAVVDLSRTRENVPAMYPIKILRDQIPDSLRVVPSRKKIRIVIERRTEKSVLVVPRIGAAPEGYIVGKPRVEPEYVMINGARSVIDRIDTLATANISVENESADVVREVEIDRENLKNVDFSDNEVRVSIPIVKLSALVSVEIPIAVRNMKKDYRYSLKRDKVTAYVRTGERSNIAPEQIVAFVDVARMALRDPATKAKVPVKEEEIEVSVYFKDGSDADGIVSCSPRRVTVKAAAK